MTVNSSILNTDEYKFIWDDPRLGKDNLVLLGLGGSHAYGTNVETSDVDIRGIALNSREEILLGRDFEQVTDNPTDTTIYSIKKIFRLLSQCNPNVIEILGLEPDQYFFMSAVGDKLLKNKEIFLSKQCIKTFGGYSTAQLYRLKQASLCSMSKLEYNDHISKVLNSMSSKFDKELGINSAQLYSYVDENGELQLHIDLPGFPADRVSSMLEILNQTIRDYKGRSDRNDKALNHGKIAKHSMHLLRLYMMCIDILENHEIVTKRTKEHDLLMSVRNGEFLDDTGKPNDQFFKLVEEYENKWKKAAENTTLPDKPNMDKIESLLIEINEFVVKQSLGI